MRKSLVSEGKKVRFVPPSQGGALMSVEREHLLSGCTGEIVLGANHEVWCYPDSEDLDLVWVRFHDDIRPVRQVSAAWLEEVAI
jgi:hypothetical protein